MAKIITHVFLIILWACNAYANTTSFESCGLNINISNTKLEKKRNDIGTYIDHSIVLDIERAITLDATCRITDKNFDYRYPLIEKQSILDTLVKSGNIEILRENDVKQNAYALHTLIGIDKNIPDKSFVVLQLWKRPESLFILQLRAIGPPSDDLTRETANLLNSIQIITAPSKPSGAKP